MVCVSVFFRGIVLITLMCRSHITSHHFISHLFNQRFGDEDAEREERGVKCVSSVSFYCEQVCYYIFTINSHFIFYHNNSICCDDRKNGEQKTKNEEKLERKSTRVTKESVDFLWDQVDFMSSSIVERNHDNPNRVYSLRCLCC